MRIIRVKTRDGVRMDKSLLFVLSAGMLYLLYCLGCVCTVQCMSMIASERAARMSNELSVLRQSGTKWKTTNELVSNAQIVFIIQ